MHHGQLDVPLDVVSALVADQFPAWAGLPVARVASHGTVNALIRIGDELAARFPLEPGDPSEKRRWLEREADAAAELRDATSFPTPEPVAIGEPGPGYPLPWAVQTWLPGTPASAEDASGSVPFAEDLAAFITEVRALDTRSRTFSGDGRGGVLADQDTWMETCFEQSTDLLDVATLRRAWAELRQLPRGAARDLMTHGDLVPGNVLVRDGHLAGVIDVGGLGPADPALDLVGAWHLLDTAPRHALRERLVTQDDEWERGRGWAFAQAMGLVWYYERSNPMMAAIGRRTLERVLAESA